MSEERRRTLNKVLRTNIAGNRKRGNVKQDGKMHANEHRHTGQHSFGGSNRVLPEWRKQIVCSRPDLVGGG